MQAKAHHPRVLAIDLHPQRFGYAVLEGAEHLLDWGVRASPPGGDVGAVVADRQVATLLRLFLPSLVVVKKVIRKETSNSSGAEPILRSIRREASARSIPVCLVARSEVRETFRIFQAETKYEIAIVLTRIFPELFGKLPPKRKTWKSEHPRMTIFDAAALGFACLQRNGAPGPPQNDP
jgi:hypothetical protein